MNAYLWQVLYSCMYSLLATVPRIVNGQDGADSQVREFPPPRQLLQLRQNARLNPIRVDKQRRLRRALLTGIRCKE